FAWVGPRTGGGAPLDTSTGSPLDPVVRVAGSVRAVAPDGAGGWYIGGSFTSVGSVPRSNLAHLSQDPSVSDWKPNADDTVLTIAVSGSVVYVGGDFTSIGGQARNRIAALDAVSGAVTAWNPNADRGVYALAVGGSTVYAGGHFGSIHQQGHPRLVAIDA